MESLDALSLACRHMPTTCHDAEMKTLRKGRRRYQQQSSALRRKLREERALAEIYRIVAPMGCASYDILARRVEEAHIVAGRLAP